jgi:hypothetical protein
MSHNFDNQLFGLENGDEWGDDYFTQNSLQV